MALDSMKSDRKTSSQSERASIVLAGVLGSFLVAAGVAMLAGWQPFADALDLAGAPRWALVPAGMASVVAGGLLFVPAASFWAGLVGIAVAIGAMGVWIAAGDAALAWAPALVLVGLVALSALRGPAAKEQVARAAKRASTLRRA